MGKFSLKNKGFTLIELLVVIAIIGLLSSVVFASLSSARGKARDAKRVAELKQIQLALEIYFDSVGSYPNTSSGWWGNCSSYGSHGVTGANGWIPNLAPTYMSTLPLDPRPTGTGGCYLYNSNGTDYKVLAHGTVESVCPVPPSNTFWDPIRNGQCTFQVSSDGARSNPVF